MKKGLEGSHVSEEFYSHENISLKLSSYNDIFSSFDPRPYSERALSVDFLDEAKRASIDKPSGDIELRIMVAENLRNPEIERVVQKRLKAHFERHAKKMRGEYKKVIQRGLAFTISGIFIMVLAAFFIFEYSESNMFMRFLLILFEPAGWFFFWEGLDLVIFDSKKKTPDLEFYEKMAKSDINFLSC